MRKQNIGFLFDKIFWYTLYMLPLFIYIIFTIQGLTAPHIDLSTEYNSLMFYRLGDCVSMVADDVIFNPIYTILIRLFGVQSSSVIPFGSYDVVLYLVYFVSLICLHLFIDVVLFIPRWCHKMLRKGEEYAED